MLLFPRRPAGAVHWGVLLARVLEKTVRAVLNHAQVVVVLPRVLEHALVFNVHQELRIVFLKIESHLLGEQLENFYELLQINELIILGIVAWFYILCAYVAESFICYV